jgi:hypothetical protein
VREVGIGGIDWAERGIAGSWLLRCRGDEGGGVARCYGLRGWMDGSGLLGEGGRKEWTGLWLL